MKPTRKLTAIRSLIAVALFSLMLGIQQRALRADIAAPLPDLKIIAVTEYATTASVTIKNVGSANSGGFYLRSYHWNGASWKTDATKWVGSIAAGGTTTVSISTKTSATFNKWFVDATNVVYESSEINNGYYIPEPAG